MLSLCACLVSHYFYRYSWLFLLSLSDVPREILVFSPMRSRLQRTAVVIKNPPGIATRFLHFKDGFPPGIATASLPEERRIGTGVFSCPTGLS